MMIASADRVMSSATCPLCSQAGARSVLSLNLPAHPIPFCLWRCRGCGVVFNHPRIEADAIREQYDGEYYVFNESPARRWARAVQLYTEHLLPLESRTKGRRLLEIGCAGGELLALARKRGWQTVGVEISPQAASRATREHGLEVKTGTLEEHADRIGPFDVAIANDVIEHVPTPRHFLRALHHVIAPDGFACLETPNWGSAWRRLGGASWLGINRFHIFLFDAACLMRLMTDCGWKQCTAGSSTNLAYTSWGSRPEISRWVGRLPAGLRWRAERWADAITPVNAALELHRSPPDCLSQAVDRIAAASARRPAVLPSLSGDNLTVIGRA